MRARDGCEASASLVAPSLSLLSLFSLSWPPTLPLSLYLFLSLSLFFRGHSLPSSLLPPLSFFLSLSLSFSLSLYIFLSLSLSLSVQMRSVCFELNDRQRDTHWETGMQVEAVHLHPSGSRSPHRSTLHTRSLSVSLSVSLWRPLCGLAEEADEMQAVCA
jgi:hypothetical protein